MDIELSPFAKINLGLFIKGKRADGYHELETLLYPLFSLRDKLILYAKEPGTCTLSIEGIDIKSPPGDNLCEKAYFALRNTFPNIPGVEIHLTKNIPAGAGLGGGSSDAAHTLLGLNELFDLKLSLDTLASIAAPLGADVPFFLYQRPMLAKGIGTDLAVFDLDFPYDIQLRTPSIFSSTIAAYKALDAQTCDPSRDLAQVLHMGIREWPALLHNDLEMPVFSMYPELKRMKQSLYEAGALYAAMSGSGSAVFGLFEK